VVAGAVNPIWQQILMSAGIYAVLQAIVSGVFTRPKTKSEANQADAGAVKMLTDAQLARQVNAIKSAEDETRRAAAACQRCENKLEHIEKSFKTFIAIVDECVPLLPDEHKPQVRAAIRSAWEAL
jgi:hypothetical protein